MAFLLPPGAAPGSLLTPAICSWREVGDLREMAATGKQDSHWGLVRARPLNWWSDCPPSSPVKK